MKMRSSFRLTVYQSGVVARLPVEIDEATLQESLLMASFFDAGKVQTIVDCAKRLGISEYSEGIDRPLYVVERLETLPEAEWHPAKGPESRPHFAQCIEPATRIKPDRLIWQIG
jgi:hypothetical protein